MFRRRWWSIWAEQGRVWMELSCPKLFQKPQQNSKAVFWQPFTLLWKWDWDRWFLASASMATSHSLSQLLQLLKGRKNGSPARLVVCRSFSLYSKKFSSPPREHGKPKSCKQNPWPPQLPSVATETPSSIRKNWVVHVERHDLSQDTDRGKSKDKEANWIWKQYRIFSEEWDQKLN